MDVFQDATMKGILKAVNKFAEDGQEPPHNLYLGESEARRIVKLFNDNSIVTKGSDGNDYIWGMKVIPDSRLDADTVYLL